MLGGGSQDSNCPNTSFVLNLWNIGESFEMEFPAGNISCAKMIRAECGAPAFRVVP